MAAKTIAQLANLGYNAAQQTKAQQFLDIGNALIAYRKMTPGATLPNISAVTLAQAKSVDNEMRDIQTTTGLIQLGAQYVRDKIMQDAATTADATPAGTF